jgi:hypothetical protein
MYIYFHKKHVLSNQTYFNSTIDKTHDYIKNRFLSREINDNKNIEEIEKLIDELNQ